MTNNLCSQSLARTWEGSIGPLLDIYQRGVKHETFPSSTNDITPSPVLIIGTYGSDGKPNIMNAAWGGIASSRPPCISVSLREATLTYHNIRQAEAFAVNIASEKYVKEADFVGMVSAGSTTNSRRPASLRKRANW
jgi:flavin reductase (DIM6/NTAB) family NADH-FMN oxidoreductase RutF